MIEKQTLQDVLKSPANKLIAVDLDGTLCEGEFWGGADPEPITNMITFITSLYEHGAHIVIYTARQPRYYQHTHAWLVKHSVPFHGICMQMKPGADLYIDDKALHVQDIL